MDQAGRVADARGVTEFIGLEALPSFSGATSIATPAGPMAAQWLRAGDLVITRDGDPQPVLAIGRVEVSRGVLLDNPGLWPIRLAAGALGNGALGGGALGGGCPAAAMVLSPWQRLLIQGTEVEKIFGFPEALVAARHLIGWPGVDCDMPEAGMRFHQLLFERHELILADGQWTESLFLDAASLAVLRQENPGLLRQLGDGHRWHARPELRDWEAGLLTPPRATPDAAFRLTA